MESIPVRFGACRSPGIAPGTDFVTGLPSILIVDHCADTTRLVSVYLHSLGYEVFTADDGVAGVAAARTHRPDLVVTDLMMPLMSGFKVIELLKDDLVYQTRILVMSAIDEPQQRAYAHALGADGYIKKPIALLDLFAEIRRLLPAVPCGELAG